MSDNESSKISAVADNSEKSGENDVSDDSQDWNHIHSTEEIEFLFDAGVKNLSIERV